MCSLGRAGSGIAAAPLSNGWQAVSRHVSASHKPRAVSEAPASCNTVGLRRRATGRLSKPIRSTSEIDDLKGRFEMDPKPRPEDEPEDDDVASIPPEQETELDEDEKEFRAMRRDLDGVKGASAVGIVTIAVSKTPGKNEFFRTHPDVPPESSRSSTSRQGMDRHYFCASRPIWSAP